MKQLTDEVFAQVHETVVNARNRLGATRMSVGGEDEAALWDRYTALLAALDTEQPEPSEDYLGKAYRLAKELFDHLAVAPAQPKRAPLICTWTQEDDFDMPGVYHTSCGEMWSFTEGGIKENNTKFCPHCGGGIKQGGQHD